MKQFLRAMYAMILCAVLAVTTVMFVSAEGETLTIKSANGLEITVSYTGAEALDWVGIYPEDRTPGNGVSYIWEYLDEGSGELTLSPSISRNNFGEDHLEPGTYTVYFCKNDGYDIAAQQEFTVGTNDTAETQAETAAETPAPETAAAETPETTAAPSTFDGAVSCAFVAIAAIAAASAGITKKRNR